MPVREDRPVPLCWRTLSQRQQSGKRQTLVQHSFPVLTLRSSLRRSGEQLFCLSERYEIPRYREEIESLRREMIGKRPRRRILFSLPLCSKIKRCETHVAIRLHFEGCPMDILLTEPTDDVMTLHWWMHWFWVTAQLTVILASPLPSTTGDPRIQEFQNRRNATFNFKIEGPTTIDPRIIEPVTTARPLEEPETSTRTSFRVAKAIGSYDPSSKGNAATANNPLNGETSSSPSSLEEVNRNVNNAPRTRTSPGNMITRRDGEANETISDTVLGSRKRDSRITWLLTTSRPPPVRRKTEDVSREDIIRNFSSISIREEEKDLTVLPLRVEATRFKLVVNRTRTITADEVDGFSTRTFNGSEDIEIDQELAEPRLAATDASIHQGGISESTRLSRARNTFSSDFQRDREEDRSSEIDVNDVIVEDQSINTEIESSTPSAVDIAAITGSCLATIVLLSTMASLGFIMYRRKYLNPPQTLNSDKCSNPDSSGYIDDSTIRDNSEEMYSLDNDSFLNSLEAMTIQNYWTDSVKHTKL